MRTALAAAWSILRRAWCRHAACRTEHRGGVWYFVCDCGYRTPVIRRDRG